MSAEETFRAETRAWLEENCPPEMRGPMRPEDHCFGGLNWTFKNEAQRLWLERMAAKGWTAPDWPKQYGGGGLKPAEAQILREEMARIDAHAPLTSLGIWMLGPALLRFGTEEQKQKYLPPIVRGEIRWCQGYSEPNAGSDLASLKTKCEVMDDGFLVNGQKIWTSYGHLSDWIFCLVRTDPNSSKHDGISFILIDMKTPGVKARPLKLLSGETHFAETFFDDVKVPKENLVGALNRGWDVAKYLLLFERAMIGAFRPDEGGKLSEFALKTLGQDALRAEPVLRAQVIAMDMKLAAFDAHLQRVADEMAAGGDLGAKGSMLKYLATELNVKRQDMMMTILGMAGLDAEGAEASVPNGFMGALANRIGGGTSEIQLNVVAKRVLGLPGA